jgi:hypothetical protein
MSELVKRTKNQDIDLTTQQQVVFFGDNEKTRVEINGLPEWVARMKRGEGQYSAVADFNMLATQKEEVEAGWIVLGVLPPSFAFLGSTPSLLFLGLSDHPVGASIATAGAILPFLAAGIVSGRGLMKNKFRRNLRYFNKNIESLREINQEGLRTWLKARYDITVSNTVLNKINRTYFGSNTELFFNDTENRSWMFSKNLKAETWFVEPYVTPVEREAINQVSIETGNDDKKLPVEAANLYQSLSEMIVVLDQESSIEVTHACLRVTEDMRSAVRDYWKLVALKAGVQGETGLVKVLNLLHAEIADLVENEVQNLVSGQSTQSEYLKSRQSFTGVGTMKMLPAVSEHEKTH